MQIFRLSALALACALSACTTVEPMNYSKERPSTAANVEERLTKEWGQVPAVREGAQSIAIVTPHAIPASILSKRISLELEPGANIMDLAAVLGQMGHSIMLQDKAVAGRTFFLPRYEGTIGGLLSTLSRLSNVWFTWSDGSIIVTAKERIGISIPQDTTLAASLEKEMKAFGIDGTTVSSTAGMLSAEMTPGQLRQVKSYLERMAANSAVVTLQLAIVNVSLNQSAKTGFDWEGLGMAVGSQAASALSDPLRIAALTNAKAYNASASLSTTTGSTSGSTTTGGTTTGGTTTTASATVNPVDALSGVLLSAGGVQGVIAAGSFSFAGMFNFLEKYGNAETQQSTVFKTVTGKEIVFKSLTEVPYVSEVGAVASQNTTSGSVKTDKAKDGLELSMVPTYDAAGNTVTVSLKLSLKAVIGFNELSAGNQIGKLTQPTTAEQSFTDELRLRPGSTAVVGGVIYDKVSDNRAVPLFLKKPGMESQNLTVQRQALFIVLRPSVARLGNVSEQDVDQINFLPEGKLVAVPEEPRATVKRAATGKPAAPKAAVKGGEASADKTPPGATAAPVAAASVKDAAPKPEVPLAVAAEQPASAAARAPQPSASAASASEYRRVVLEESK